MYIYFFIYIHTIYILLNHFAVHLKLAQHCKSTILQLKKKTSPLRMQDENTVEGVNSHLYSPAKWFMCLTC